MSMLTLRTVLGLVVLGLGFWGCYRPGDLGDTPYLCTSERPACPDGYVCAVSLGACVRKSSSSRQASAVPKAEGAAPAAAAAAKGLTDGCSAKEGELPEAEVELLGDGPAEGGDIQDSEGEGTVMRPDCGR